MVFCWLAWEMISSRMAFVFVCSYMMLLSRISFFERTLVISCSMRADSCSVYIKEFLSMTSCSSSFFFSALSSAMRDVRNSISFFLLLSLS